MKKNKIVMCGMFLAVTLLAGCGKQTATEEKTVQDQFAEKEPYRIVCTTFPQYDWIREIIGETDSIELELLLENGTDIHSYQPTAQDIARIASTDMLVYVGGESDGWVEDVLAEASGSERKVVSLLETLGERVKEEELVEGMEAEEHEHDEHEEHAHENEAPEYDEHVWLSIKNAITLTEELSAFIQEMDVTNASQYAQNTSVYIEKLKTLDAAYEKTVQEATVSTLVFGDRFPFRYLVEDYHIPYYAAFAGCSAETEASFQTITFLSGKVDELQIPVILVLESSDQKIAQAVCQNTKEQNQEILVMNSLQSVTSKEQEAGVNYLKVMEENLEVLKQAMK